tara:strand:+ start:5413 stop:6030 length:618 start_codon:yes stop_codon:yes gene_type:complete
MQNIIYIFDLFGTAIFALTGVLAGFKHRMDPFGILVLAIVTAVGGGTTRDIILGVTPVFWLSDSNYLWMISITVLLSLVMIRESKQARLSLLQFADAFGLALFTMIGADKALMLGYSWNIAIFMGVLTGVGGGIMRDVLCRRIPLVLQKEVYATAALIGALVYSSGFYLGLSAQLSAICSISTTLAIRLAAIYWQMSLPILNSRY